MTLIDPRKKAIQIIDYTLKEKLKHQSWCFKNDIKIYPVPIDIYNCKIVIEVCGVPEIGAHIYKSDLKKLKKNDENWSDIIWKLYTIKYLEFNNKQNGQK